MRKLKLQVQITIDGFISGTNGEMDWLQFAWSDDLIEFVKQLTEPIDTILLGKNLAEGFIPHWENVAQNPQSPEYEAGIKFSSTPKVVFSRTLATSKWKNTVIAKDLVLEVNRLKSLEGGDLMAYGGGAFVASLIKEKLIDEINLFVNPVAIGKGMPIFQEISEKQSYQLLKAKAYDCGIIVLTYKPL